LRQLDEAQDLEQVLQNLLGDTATWTGSSHSTEAKQALERGEPVVGPSSDGRVDVFLPIGSRVVHVRQTSLNEVSRLAILARFASLRRSPSSPKRSRVEGALGDQRMVGRSRSFKQFCERLRTAAAAESTILLLGESGNSPQGLCTLEALDERPPLLPQTAGPSPETSWRASSLATKREHLRVPSQHAQAFLRWPMAGPSSWTRLVSSH
jgi:hypothetical protein